MYVKKDCVWNPAMCNCENEKYLASIMDDSVITCDEIIKSDKESGDSGAKLNDKAKPFDKTNFNEKKATCKMENLYILLGVLLITIVLLIAVSVYCYLIKYWAKQKHLLPFNLSNKLKEIIY